ncbi:MAG: agmatine deiminase family protein [Phycisphaerae bacterium]|nr:agmatine deiminase family protein [Phycisphaerae bacterium]
MNRLLSSALVLFLSCWGYAQEAASVPAESRDRTVDAYPNGLPKYMTPEERRIPWDRPTPEDFDSRSPPTGEVHCAAEYEPMAGLLIAWEGYSSVLTAMAVGITTNDPEAIVWVVVDSSSEQTSAYNSLNTAGADMDQVEFIIRTTDTVWIRDYGPRYIFEDDNRAIIDHTYNRPRPNDNTFNDYLASLWGEPEYKIPLTHGGGNFHLFSNGDAFMTDLILDENPGLSEQDVKDLYEEYQNVDLTIYPGFPTTFDSTQHIDMWMLPLDDGKVIIGEYDSSTGQPYTITENAVTDLESRGYTVYRTPGWRSGGTHYTYTNAVIINDLVFIPEFSGYSTQNAQTLSVFESALPDHTMFQVDCSSIITAAGAMHCIVMHVPAYAANLLVTPGSSLVASGPAGGPFTPDSIDYTLENTFGDPIDYSVTKSEAWVSITNATGTLPAHGTTVVTVSINSAADSLGNGVYEDTVNFVNTTNHSGDTTRGVTLGVGIPEVIHSFPMNSNPGWSTEGQWAFGDPTGDGGTAHGNPDPDNGATGAYVYGVNLSGDYSTTVGGPYCLTTGPMDLTGVEDVTLKFQRWLNTDYAPYVHATLEASNNGSDWVPVWQNGDTDITDSTWSELSYDISSVADGQETVYIRWSCEIGQTGAYAYSGWNIDDVEIWGLAADPCAGIAPDGDIDGDGDTDGADIRPFVEGILGSIPQDQVCRGDFNGNKALDAGDIEPMVNALLAP